jgi:XTP/dITP diphosphohydrolase
MKRLVLASNNPGKLREIGPLLAGLAFEVVAQGQLGIPEADEPHDSFLENALAKARHASRAAGLPALADDSGLSVPALGGSPGVHSAYCAGRAGSREERDQRNNAKLLEALAPEPTKERAAYYTCVIALVRGAGDPAPLIAQAHWYGEIARAPRGGNGFGYDPLFYLPALGKTAAELDPAQKNALSHRGQALAQLLSLLKNADLP